MSRLTFCIIFAFPVFLALIQAEELYSVVGPGTLHSNKKYKVLVTAHTTKEVTIRVGIEGPAFEKKTDVTLGSLSSKLVELEIPDLKNGTYSLTAEGISGLDFKNSSVLNFDDNSVGVFVQTDKATYKPGDLMQFRVLFLDGNTKPAIINQPIVVFVEDPKENRIKHFADVKPTKGVFKGKLQLSEYPLFGDWKIGVQIDEKSIYNKTFLVDKYVLPKFEVKIGAPKKILHSDSLLSFPIRAVYTFGKPVMGKAYVTVSAISGRANPPSPVKMELDLKPQNYIRVPMRNIFGAGTVGTKTIMISVEVQEQYTGSKIIANATTHTVKDEFSIDSPTTNCYHAGELVQYTITVTDLDDKPVSDPRNPVHFVADTKGGASSFDFLKDGEAKATFECPKDQSLDLKISYKGQTVSRTIERTKSIGIVVTTEKPELNKPMEIELYTGDHVNYVVYAVVAHGQIVASDIVISKRARDMHQIVITPTLDMMPRANIFAYHIKDNELKYFESSFTVEDDSLNKISVVTAKDKVAPGADVVLTVNTDEDSYVGLLAVDKSVLLLRSGNDFKQKEIEKSLQRISTAIPKYLHSHFTYPGVDSGLVTISNAHFDSGDNADVVIRMGGDKAIQNKIRKDFLETWFYDDITSTKGKSSYITRKIPDTITSWFITGFSLNSKTGLALTKAPTVVTTFKPFFITASLPYSIKRGELLSVPVIIFNYMKQLQVEVTLESENDEFEFMDTTPDSKSKEVFAPSRDTAFVNFEIRAKRLGYITLKFSARAIRASDEIHMKLKVEPEGVTKFKNKEYMLKDTDNVDAVINIPKNVVSDSEHIEISLTGNVLGTPIDTVGDTNKFKNLVRMPTGCGEQNMLATVPNILVLRYLEFAGKKNIDVEKKAKEYIELGYQREMNYKANGGAFSTFGGGQGSTWLTAYVVRSFHQAAKYVHIDPKIINNGLDFLAKQQDASGKFVEHGRIVDFAHLNQLGLTAYVLLTFLDNPEAETKYKNVIDLGMQHLEQEIKTADDLYGLSIAMYALQLRKPDLVRAVLPRVYAKAETKDGYKWWSRSSADTRSSYNPTSHDVEVTAYLLMTLLDLNEPAMPTAKWLLSKRNSNGGFASSVETVVAFQALTKFAQKNIEEYEAFLIDVDCDKGKETHHFNITKGNEMIMQKISLPNDVRSVQFKSKGKGKAIAQLSYRYNILEDEDSPYFKIKQELKSDNSGRKLFLDVEVEFEPVEEKALQEKNMVIVEITLPSGYTVTPEAITEISRLQNVNRVETAQSDTKVIVYVENMAISQWQYIPVEAELNHAVASQKAVPIYVYEYYDTTWRKRAIHYYKFGVQECDICNDDECRENC